MLPIEQPAHRFVVPPLDGPVTGGTLYNRKLIDALAQQGFRCDALDIDGARAALASGWPGWYWVDTLYLGEIEALRAARVSPKQSLGLLTHYLPSLARGGDAIEASDLTLEERLALRTARAFVVSSRFMRRTLNRLGVRRPVFVVEPGCELDPIESAPTQSGVRALMVANVIPNKGLAELLTALGAVLLPTDPFVLTVVGSLDLSASYAASCLRLVADNGLLAPRVTFSGAAAPGEVRSHLSACNLFVSSSRMEAYGMAIAEARTAGLPIVACDGGNARALVVPAAGGQVVPDAAELARACVRVCRNPDEHERRIARARHNALAPRAWSVAARELVAHLVTLGERTRRPTNERTRA